MKVYKCRDDTKAADPVELTYAQALTEEGIYCQAPFTGATGRLIVVRESGNGTAMAFWFSRGGTTLEVPAAVKAYAFNKTTERLCIEIKA